MAVARPSPFLDPGARIAQGQLALIHLKRDLITPVVVDPATTSTDGYAEPVVNTRFGSFPHSGLVNVPWGSQVRAANVDTGARGRKAGKKRKRDDASGPATGEDEDESAATSARETTAASTGFAHILPPTPETWTVSLPHRTQVVYTPDYSYVLQRLRVRPGDTIIEAGAGSGSFTHASVRAVFNGTPSGAAAAVATTTTSKKRKRDGHVYSFEFHEPRAEQLRKELAEHGLGPLVTVTHADVYENGFQPASASTTPVNADAIFLDLPAPWLALKHLTRRRNTAPAESSTPAPPQPDTDADEDAHWRSPLNPRKTVRICTFSPCIEQVQRTTAELRRLGWVNIEMVEILHRRLDVRRERVGLQEEGLRGVNATAATVDEAVGRLREVEGRFRAFHELQKESAASTAANTPSDAAKPSWGRETKEQRLQKIREREKQRKTWKEGRLVHRTEPEIKTHTSYLCFALLPREWSEADEERAQRRWGNAGVGVGPGTAVGEEKGSVVKSEA